MKRSFLCVAAAIALLAVSAQSSECQILPWSIGLDSSWRVGYVFGRQFVRFDKADVSGDPAFGHIRSDFAPQLPILSGMCEFSPFGSTSLRLAGTTSVIAGDFPYEHTSEDPINPTEWNVKPDFKHWEAAVLYHLYNDGAYRFSAVAGYRQERWKYTGDPNSGQGPDSWLKNEFNSRIPFLALQTALFYPWWRARFEVMGSPFMSERILTRVRDSGQSADYEGTADSGGLIAFEMEGSAAVSSTMRVGAYARYGYQELYGEYSRTSQGTELSDDMFVQQHFVTFALNVNIIF